MHRAFSGRSARGRVLFGSVKDAAAPPLRYGSVYHPCARPTPWYRCNVFGDS